MALTTTSPAVEPTASPGPGICGWDHLEMWVGNARAVAHFLAAGFGFEVAGYAGPETGVRDRASYLLRQGTVTVVVTAGLDPASPVGAHVLRHGDGVRVVAFASDDVDGTFHRAVLHGASPVAEPHDLTDPSGCLRVATVEAYAGTLHSFIDRRGYHGLFRPGFQPDGLPQPSVGGTVGLEACDHVVANVEEGRLDEWVAWYGRTLGLSELRHFDADQISTEYSALRSTVVWNGSEVKLPVNEPAPGRRRSQIQEYLDAYVGPGVQHVALATSDIVATVAELRRRGIRFLSPPTAYYEAARERCAGVDVDWEAVSRLGILVDRESGGHLLQVFTENLSDRPTLFLEVIQRHGAVGFGEGNFKALFEAIEAEQARRGNL
ncbi:MAG TPA: 4-hydroxyphenylpyruvate dioxygenase [Acidimicrobiales bacterium]|nr:4-hydroxyphenylpyruvate dioxygenase [Acidimicrobiales bacterium]